MKKVFTAYAMYFNIKYQRTGPLFSGRYKCKHLDTDRYFKYALQYVLFNPVELIEPTWKRGGGDTEKIENKLRAYRYASVNDFFNYDTSKSNIVTDVCATYFERKPTLSSMLRDAQLYYRENAKFLDS